MLFPRASLLLYKSTTVWVIPTSYNFFFSNLVLIVLALNEHWTKLQLTNWIFFFHLLSWRYLYWCILKLPYVLMSNKWDQRYDLNWQEIMMSLNDLVALFFSQYYNSIAEHEDSFESGSVKFI